MSSNNPHELRKYIEKNLPTAVENHINDLIIRFDKKIKEAVLLGSIETEVPIKVSWQFIKDNKTKFEEYYKLAKIDFKIINMQARFSWGEKNSKSYFEPPNNCDW